MDTRTTALFNQTGTLPEVICLENCEIAKVEGTVSLHNPIMTFSRSYVYVNTELLKRVHEMVYAQFLVDRAEKKLILRSCDAREQDAVRLRTISEAAVKPRHILAGEFVSRLFIFMNWNTACRYKIIGNIISSDGAAFVVFDLTCAESFEISVQKNDVAPDRHHNCSLPDDSFGPTVEERSSNPLVTQFSENTEIIPEAYNDNKKKQKNCGAVDD